MKNLKLFEEFNEAARSMAGEEIVDHGKPVDIKEPLTKSVFDVYVRHLKNKTLYDFVEKYPEYYPGKSEDDDEYAAPLVYTYSLELGNITRGSADRWARQEVRSTSKAFHKGNFEKMAIPNDLKRAAKAIYDNYNKYLPKKKGEFESAAFPDWLYEPKKGNEKITELQSDLKKAIASERFEAADRIKRKLENLLKKK